VPVAIEQFTVNDPLFSKDAPLKIGEFPSVLGVIVDIAEAASVTAPVPVIVPTVHTNPVLIVVGPAALKVPPPRLSVPTAVGFVPLESVN